MSAATFRVGLTGDFLTSAGAPNFEVSARAMLESAPGVAVEFLKRPPAAPVTHDDLVRYDALLIKRNPVDASVLAAADCFALMAAGSDESCRAALEAMAQNREEFA